MMAIDVVGRIHRPEYTGVNRCIPCTVLNVLIASVIAGLLAVGDLFWIGIITFTACVVVIYLRGYLVPGTPTITERYFPDRVLLLFDKDLGYRRDPEGTTSGQRSTTALVAAGIVTREGNEIELSSAFRDAWRKRIHSLREREVSTEDVQSIYDADSITSHSQTSFVVDKNKSVRWVSKAALTADVAGAMELDNRMDEWHTLDKSRREKILIGIRLFLRQCPVCDGSLSVTEDRVDPCCQKAQIVIQSVCEDCNAPIVDTAVVDTDENSSTGIHFLRA